VLVVPEDDFLTNVYASGLNEVDFSEIGDDDARLEELAEQVDDSPGWVASLVTAYPWWEPPTDAKWAQLTFLPTANPDELDDETIKLAVKATRFGWNFLTAVNIDSEVTEIRRHLSSSPVVLAAE
jgi:hypothetical protein